jgi:hypothetical protein
MVKVVLLLKCHGGGKIKLHVIVTSSLDGGKRLDLLSGRFIPGEGALIPLIRKLGGPRASLRAVGNESL